MTNERQTHALHTRHLARPALLLVALALTGCATTRYATVHCIGKDQSLPAEPPRIKSQLTGEADKDLRIVAGSAVRLRAWGEGLQTILEGCREPTPNKP
jgi:hypothetical protein